VKRAASAQRTPNLAAAPAPRLAPGAPSRPAAPPERLRESQKAIGGDRGRARRRRRLTGTLAAASAPHSPPSPGMPPARRRRAPSDATLPSAKRRARAAPPPPHPPPPPPADWASLPAPALLAVLAYLGLHRLSALRVCRAWRDAGAHPSFTTRVAVGARLNTVLATAPPGQTIVVPPGLYSEPLLIRSPVRLVAAAPASSARGDAWPVVLQTHHPVAAVVAAAACRIDGFAIRTARAAPDRSAVSFCAGADPTRHIHLHACDVGGHNGLLLPAAVAAACTLRGARDDRGRGRARAAAPPPPPHAPYPGPTLTLTDTVLRNVTVDKPAVVVEGGRLVMAGCEVFGCAVGAWWGWRGLGSGAGSKRRGTQKREHRPARPVARPSPRHDPNPNPPQASTPSSAPRSRSRAPASHFARCGARGEGRAAGRRGGSARRRARHSPPRRLPLRTQVPAVIDGAGSVTDCRLLGNLSDGGLDLVAVELLSASGALAGGAPAAAARAHAPPPPTALTAARNAVASHSRHRPRGPAEDGDRRAARASVAQAYGPDGAAGPWASDASDSDSGDGFVGAGAGAFGGAADVGTDDSSASGSGASDVGAPAALAHGGPVAAAVHAAADAAAVMLQGAAAAQQAAAEAAGAAAGAAAAAGGGGHSSTTGTSTTASPSSSSSGDGASDESWSSDGSGGDAPAVEVAAAVAAALAGRGRGRGRGRRRGQ